MSEAARRTYRGPAGPQGVSDWISWPGVGLGVLGAGVYLYSTLLGKKAEELGGAAQIGKLEDLKSLVGVLPALVAVRGRVNSLHPLRCELCDKQAVIHEVVEEEVWRKQRAEGRTVYEPFETRKVFEEREWFVEDGSGVRVRVENALHAQRLRSAMEVKSEFTPEDLGSKTLGKVLMEKAWQMTKHGMRKTERYLPVGAVVTCVGELSTNHIHRSSSSSGAGPSSSSLPSSGTSVSSSSHTGSSPSSSSPSSLTSGQGSSSSSGGAGKGSGGMGLDVIAGPLRLRGLGGGEGSGRGDPLAGADPVMPFVLRKPVSGPSYITPLTLDQLRGALSSSSHKCKWVAGILGAVGGLLIVRKLVSCVLRRLHERRVRARVAQAEAARKAQQAEARAARALARAQAGAAAGGATEDGGASDSSSYEGDRERDTCVICLEGRADTVFTACGHMCACEGCSLSLDKCPICRIRSRPIKVYRP